MKKKNAFTLIELLAVIVVLAIIALIATPIVMNTIKNAKKGAAERTADNYIDAVETTVATKRLEGDILEGTYTINDKGNLEGNGLIEPLEIEMNGNKPSGGTITIKDGQATTDSKMTIGSYEVAYNPTNKKYEATEENDSQTNLITFGYSNWSSGEEGVANIEAASDMTWEEFVASDYNTVGLVIINYVGSNTTKQFVALKGSTDEKGIVISNLKYSNQDNSLLSYASELNDPGRFGPYYVKPTDKIIDGFIYTVYAYAD